MKLDNLIQNRDISVFHELTEEEWKSSGGTRFIITQLCRHFSKEELADLIQERFKDDEEQKKDYLNFLEIVSAF